MTDRKRSSMLLNAQRENELLQSFVRVTSAGSDEKPKSQQSDQPKSKIVEKPKVKFSDEVKKLQSDKPQKEDKDTKPSQRRRKIKINKCEELYTDKDRAAAVNMGSRDIKQSLKLKRQEDRSKNLQIPEEANPAQFLFLGHYEMGRGELKIAMNFINKALELNPKDKNAFVARSKCHILLGHPDKGLQDAETALTIDKSFLKAIYQKAEALYHLGDFEHSLMYFHRGLHIRPDNDQFKLGVEKAQKAIETALGYNFDEKKTDKSRDQSRMSSRADKTEQRNKSRIRAKSCTRGNTKILQELAIDKEYLGNLLNNPDILCHHKDANDPVIGYIKEAVEYLNQREEFWRQQLPPKKNS